MKTKKIMIPIMVAATMGLIFTGCKKTDTTPATTTSTTDDSNQQATSAADLNNVENESAKSLDDANASIDGSSSLRSSTGPCNVTIDSSSKSTGLIKLTFIGNTCDNTRSRSGSIDLQFPNNGGTINGWHNKNAVVTLTYHNYKVTNLSDNKSLTFNGTHIVTNVSGGRLSTLTPGASIVHKITGDMQITFDDGTVRSWSIARTRTFTSTNGVLYDQITGDTTINNHTNVAMWGTNRAGENFAISITTPVVVEVSGGTCSHKPLSGVRVHHGLARELTVTYGVDASGTPEPAGTCPYGCKLDWTNARGVAKEVIRSY